MAKNNNWTREETIIAFNVYCKVPFKSSSKTNPTIIKYANIIGRSPSALNMKVGNFGRLDPELRKQGIVGLGNGSKLDEIIWNEFNGNWDKLAFESEKLIAEFQNKSIEQIETLNIEDFPKGEERETIIKARVNQSFFRSTILSSYNLKCCITGLSITDFLVASHIKPWSKDLENRTNPHNGLCLNSIHDKAFDRGFITVTPDFKILVSNFFDDYSNDLAVTDFFKKYQNQFINLPDRFLPSKEFLDWHYSNIFIKQRKFEEIHSLGGSLNFINTESSIFGNNLILIDSALPKIISETLKKFFTSSLSKSVELINSVTKSNPLNFDLENNHPFYIYKFKRFITDIALGMTPSKVWTGQLDATGGYLVVKEDGEVLCYHIYNRNEFEDYLYSNTKFETASSSRHDFGSIYKENEKLYFKLNLQIRFI